MENRGDNKMTKILISAAVLTVLSMNVAEAKPFGKVNTHIGAVSVNKTSATNTWPESQVKGYIGKGKMVTGYDAKGEAIVGECRPPYTDHGC